MLKCAGRFCFYEYMSIRIPFVKTYFTPQELVQLLKARGMKIADEEKARHYISHIGYYRLSAYMHPLLSMPKEQHIFKQGATFDKVMCYIASTRSYGCCYSIFGVITNIYSNIKNKKLKKHIAQSFGLQVAPFESWLTIIAVTRNSCCHHARIWNRTFSIRATLPIRMSRPWISLPTDPLKVYFDLCIIKYFLDVISPNNDMLGKMQNLFTAFPEIDKAALGFPIGWEKEPLWQ